MIGAASCVVGAATTMTPTPSVLVLAHALDGFGLFEDQPESLLRRLIEGEAGILSLSIERAGLHDAFVAIAGEAAARALEASPDEETAR